MGFLSERRLHPRYPRRLEVRFWRQSESQAHSGFTTNVSKTGIFLGTGHLLAPGERVRVEVMDLERGFVVEGRVVRVHRVSLALRHVDQPGVGVRFLLPEELVTDLVPAARAGTAAALRAGTAVSVQDAEGARPEAAEAGSGDFEAAPAEPGPRTREAAPAGADSAGPAPAPPPVRPRVVPVDFPDRSTFLSVYHRDLATGGLLVSTPEPAALQEVVLIELRTPLAGAPPLRFEARVVHRFEPRAAVGAGRNLLSGMGVQFLDPDGVRAALAPILAELRK